MAGSAPKPLKFLGMGNMSTSDQAAVEYDPPAIPQDPAALAAAVLQLQNTVNELIARHNALCAASALPSTANEVTGAGQAATNLFTAS